MKILMTTDTVGGVWCYVMELTHALERFGAEVALATMGAELAPWQRTEIAARPNITLYESEYRLEWMPDPWASVEEASGWLLELAGKLRPDVVHLNNYAQGALPWPAPVLMVGHSCVLSWWQAVYGRSAPPTWSRYRQVVADGVGAADMIVAPTQAMLSTLDQFYGPLPEARVIPNAREPAAYLPARKEPLVLAAGRLWDAAKNVQMLAQAAQGLAWPVVVAGEAQHPDRWAASFPNVRALGKLTPAQLASWYARAAIYALPARYEPFGLSALEAALSGCALVLGDIPSLREVWGDAAMFVEPEDHQALQRAIELLIADARLRTRFAARARRRALQFTPRAIGRGYFAAYQDLLAYGEVPGAARTL
jgi:glycogen synthase